MRALALDASRMYAKPPSWCPVGCDKCRGNGYRGRMGIFEIFMIDDEVRDMINEQLTTTAAPPAAPANSACAPCARTASARCSPA